MREILFRGKEFDSEKWVEGGILQTKLFTSIYVVSDLYINEIGVIPETVGQFAGLTDKHGKKIFEGDIVKYENKDGIKFKNKLLTVFGEVVYNKQTASFAVDGFDNIGGKQYDYFPINNIEIIGNIYDNPELLEVQND